VVLDGVGVVVPRLRKPDLDRDVAAEEPAGPQRVRSFGEVVVVVFVADVHAERLRRVQRCSERIRAHRLAYRLQLQEIDAGYARDVTEAGSEVRLLETAGERVGQRAELPGMDERQAHVVAPRDLGPDRARERQA